MTIYQEIILEHASHPRNIGSIPNATRTVTVHNTLCGDKIEMDILIEDDVVTSLRFIGKGCAISKASSSLLSEYVRNKTKQELKKLGKKDIIKLLGIDLGPNRLKCALLPLEALQKLLI